MFGGQSNPQVTIRSIINRGGEQGAQHSQLLHSLFAHIPGLRVVMPYSVSDARDLLIASVLCKDPVIYIDDRWLYDEKDVKTEINFLNLEEESAKKILEGMRFDCNFIWLLHRYEDAIKNATQNKNISIELFDLGYRSINMKNLLNQY